MVITVTTPEAIHAWPIRGELTGREARVIKEIAGLRLGDITDGLRHGDADLGVALAIIAAARHGIPLSEDTLLDLPATAIDIDLTEPADPPADQPVAEPVDDDQDDEMPVPPRRTRPGQRHMND